MPHSPTRLVARGLCAAFLGTVLMQTAAHATVSGSYQGVIDQDSGLGLLGQTMRVDFVYDETASPDFNFGQSDGGSGFFFDVVSAMTVRIGNQMWTWNSAGSSSIILNNDYVQSFSVGAEDGFALSGSDFNGPGLVADVSSQSYEASVDLIDTLPTGFPDALSSHTALPASAPSPGLFRVPGPGDTEVDENHLRFAFTAGDLELGDRYFIRASNVTPVPEPSAALMLLAGLGLVGIAVHARRQRRG